MPPCVLHYLFSLIDCWHSSPQYITYSRQVREFIVAFYDQFPTLFISEIELRVKQLKRGRRVADYELSLLLMVILKLFRINLDFILSENQIFFYFALRKPG